MKFLTLESLEIETKAAKKCFEEKEKIRNIENDMVTREYMDAYIEDIQCRVQIGTLPLEDMRIVEKYKEYKQRNREFKKIDFKKLMKQLME